jgi:heme A synthase
MAVLAVWLARSEPRRWVRGLGFAALGTVILQAVLGGMTVLLLLPPAVSVSHACLAQTFFCLTIAIALVTSRGWTAIPSLSPSASPSAPPPASSSASPSAYTRRWNAATNTFRQADDDRAHAGAASNASGTAFAGIPPSDSLALLTFGAVYVQLTLGAVMRHMEAGLAIPDFPLAFGRLLPPHWSGPIAINFAHRVWAIAVVALGTALMVRILRAHHGRPDLRWPAILLGLLLPSQVILGAATVLSLKQAFVATAHVATGALILATSLVLAVRLCRPRVEEYLAARASLEKRRASPREVMTS